MDEYARPLDDEDDVDWVPVTTALLCGAAFGAVLALLYAPAHGRDTRHWMQQRAVGAGNWVTDFVTRHRPQLYDVIRRRGVAGLSQVRPLQ
jgi:hypothetical protein